MIAGIVCTLVFAACGGTSGGRTSTVPPAVATKAPASSVRITLTIPARATLGRRRTAYVSSSTQSMLFTALPGSIASKINLNAQLCTTNPLNGDKLCTFSVTAPVGADTFTVVAYDQPFDVAGNLPGFAHALSGASSFAVTVAEGAANVSVPLITGGVPVTVAVALAGGPKLALTGASATAVTFTAYDADNNVIVAPGAFSDLNGNAAPLTALSSAGTANLGYAVTSAATGTTGPTGATISLAEPDDTVALNWNGTAYVPNGDALTLQNGLTIHGGGGMAALFGFGYRIPAAALPFAPAFLLPLSPAIYTAIGHAGVLIAGAPNKAGFIGDTTSTCTIASVEGGSVTAMGGATLDEPATPTDTNFYVTLTDNNLRLSSEYTIASVLAGGACTLMGSGGGIDNNAPGGIAAAGNLGLDVSTIGGGVSQVDAYQPIQGFSRIYTTGVQGTLFTPRAIAVLPSGASGVVQFAEKKILVGYNGNAAQTGSEGLAGLTDGYPVGVTVDVSGNIYVNDTTSVTFNSVNGGIDMFSSITSGVVASAKLNAPIGVAGPNYQEQNLTVGAYRAGSALYVICGDGIEVFALPMTGTLNAPVETIPMATSATSIAGNNDGRVWALLSDGSILAFPPQ